MGSAYFNSMTSCVFKFSRRNNFCFCYPFRIMVFNSLYGVPIEEIVSGATHLIKTLTFVLINAENMTSLGEFGVFLVAGVKLLPF